MKWNLTEVLIGIPLMTNVKHLFICLLAIYISSLEKYSDLLPTFKLGGLFYCWALKIIYSGYRFLFRYRVCKHFPYSVGCLHFVFWIIKVLIFDQVQFTFVGVILVSYLRNHCLNQHQIFLFSSMSFIVLVLTFKSFIHFELLFASSFCLWIFFCPGTIWRWYFHIVSGSHGIPNAHKWRIYF